MTKWPALILVGVLTQTAHARLLSTRPSPSETWSPLFPLIVGGNFEFETDDERSLYEFPLLVEYNFSEQLKTSIEPNFVYYHSKDPDVPSVGGPGDLETSLEWEFLRERRYRPALTLEGIVKWPTASDSELGDPGTDYSLGLIASKDVVYAEVDLSFLYTFSGDPEASDCIELIATAECPLNYRFSILAETAATIETRNGATDLEGTLGLAWRATDFLTLEGGGTVSTDGTWQIIFAWEWSFAGED